MNEQFRDSCKKCKYFVWLTNEEFHYLDKIAGYFTLPFETYGVCLWHNKIFSNFLIQRIFWQEEDIFCSLYEEGPFVEELNIRCPKCLRAPLHLIRRPFNFSYGI